MLYHASGEHPSPCGLYDSLCTLRVGRSTVMSILPSHATLGTGGWLFLTRQGLSPCKKHQALPGAHVVDFVDLLALQTSSFCHTHSPGPQNTKPRSPLAQSNGVFDAQKPFEKSHSKLWQISQI